MSWNPAANSLAHVLERFYAGARLSAEDGIRLYQEATPLELARMAHWMRMRKHPENVVTYIVGRNINYTNVCWVRCGFCAFYRPPGSPEGYVLSEEELFAKIRETVDAG